MVSNDMTLAEAKAWLRPLAMDKGAHCPCCNQWTQIYKTAIHSGAGKVLAIICTAYDRGILKRGDFLHVENYMTELKQRMKGYHGKLRFWNLVEPKPNEDPKKKSSGYWRPTDDAFNLVHGTGTVPKYAYLFNNKCIGLSPERVTFKEIMKNPFDYSELMNAMAEEHNH